MAKNLLAGFVSGFANNQVDQSQERRKLENEEKKAKMLANLQRETAQANFLFEENFKKSNRVDESMSTVDPDTGKITKRALDGTVLGEGSMTPAEIAAHKRKVESEELGIAGKRQSMDNDNTRLSLEQQRLQDNRNERAERRAERKAAGLDGTGGAGGAGAAGVGAALVSSYGDTVKGLVSKGISRVHIEKMAADVVGRLKMANPKMSGAALEEASRSAFLQSLELLNSGIENPDDTPDGFKYNPKKASENISSFRKRQGI